MEPSTSSSSAIVKPRVNELNKFAIFTDVSGIQGKRSKLAWCIRDGNPRISVYTNDPRDTVNYGIIPCAMNPETFFIFLDLLENIAKGENNQKNKIECYAAFRNENGTMQEKTLQSELYFGKDQNGIVWISAVAGNRPKIKFEIKLSDFHKIYNANGNQLTESEGSVLQALTIVSVMKKIYAKLVSEFRVFNTNNGLINVSKPQPITDGSSNTFLTGSDTVIEDIAF